ncbi:unnamed protein product [Sphagnum jensenii]|uniref:Uncharacterized protein n=1 Tax=Sphagnum jensenii TaxID=128206 RepID=A0ABP1BBV4_9BRYO
MKFGRNLDGSRTNVERNSDGNRTKVRRSSDENRTKFGRMSDVNSTDVGGKSDESPTNVGGKSDESPTNVERKLDESPTDIKRAELNRHYCDDRWRHCTATPSNATLRRGQQNVATHCYGEAGRTLQLAAMARSAVGCSSLLQQWPAALELTTLGRQRYNSRQWPIARYSPSQC